MKYTVKASSFVQRQIKGSGKSYSTTLSFDDIALLAESRLNKNNFKDGYREGVVIVTLDESYSSEFICPLIKINGDTNLIAKYVKRRENEEPYIQIRARGGQRLNFLLFVHRQI